jgi:hypothetical protein
LGMGVGEWDGDELLAPTPPLWMSAAGRTHGSRRGVGLEREQAARTQGQERHRRASFEGNQTKPHGWYFLWREIAAWFRPVSSACERRAVRASKCSLASQDTPSSADLRATVGRPALLLELEGADALLPGLEGREDGIAPPPALAHLPEPIATCQMGSFLQDSFTIYF